MVLLCWRRKERFKHGCLFPGPFSLTPNHMASNFLCWKALKSFLTVSLTDTSLQLPELGLSESLTPLLNKTVLGILVLASVLYLQCLPRAMRLWLSWLQRIFFPMGSSQLRERDP